MNLEYIVPVDVKNFEDGQFNVELWDFSRSALNRKSMIEAGTLVASVCYDKKTAIGKEKLFKHFEKQSETPLEFIRKEKPFGIGNSYRNYRFFDHETSELYETDIEAKIQDHKNNVATFKLRVPLFVVGHLVRHRQFSFMQISRRYTKVEGQDISENFYLHKNDFLRRLQLMVIENCCEAYDTAIENGIEPQDARLLLTAYAVLTDIWLMGDITSYAWYFKVRLNEEKVQRETLETARIMKELIKENQPQVWERIVLKMQEIKTS